MAFSRVAGAAATGIKVERFKIRMNHGSFQPYTVRDAYDVHVTPCRRAICGGGPDKLHSNCGIRDDCPNGVQFAKTLSESLTTRRSSAAYRQTFQQFLWKRHTAILVRTLTSTVVAAPSSPVIRSSRRSLDPVDGITKCQIPQFSLFRQEFPPIH